MESFQTHSLQETARNIVTKKLFIDSQENSEYSLFEQMEKQWLSIPDSEALERWIEQFEQEKKIKQREEPEAYEFDDSSEDSLHLLPALATMSLTHLSFIVERQSPDWVASLLIHMTPLQRQLLIDLNGWKKDHLQLQAVGFWIKVYGQSENFSLVEEFVSHGTFLTYLKGVFHISTFDVEDPQYPDHDRYFLTDDQLLLFEYDESNTCAEEVQRLIRIFYSQRGVEQAYTFLFKLVSDSFLSFEEEEFQQAKERLREVGHVDYYSALEILSHFPTELHLKKWIKKKYDDYKKYLLKNHHKESATVVDLTKEYSIMPFWQKVQIPTLSAIQSMKDVFDRNFSHDQILQWPVGFRRDYLRFNFVRLLNACLIQRQGPRKESKETLGQLTATKNYLFLGLNYLQEYTEDYHHYPLWEIFDGTELAKIGRSLIYFLRSQVKKNFSQLSAQEDDQWTTEEYDQYIGDLWRERWDGLFSDLPYVQEREHKKEIDNLEKLKVLQNQCEQFSILIPYMSSFKTIYQVTKNHLRQSPDYYLNYDVETLDWECFLLTSVSLFHVYESSYCRDQEAKDATSFEEWISRRLKEKKFGLDPHERQQWFEKYFMEQGLSETSLPESLTKLLEKFCAHYSTIGHTDIIQDYIRGLIIKHLIGLDYHVLTHEDYRHVGGILFY